MNTDTQNTSPNFELHPRFAVPAERVFSALATADGVKGWWTLHCEVSEAVGGQSSYHFPSGGFFAVMRTLRREPSRLLEWECIDSKHDDSTGYADLHDWSAAITLRAALDNLGRADASAPADMAEAVKRLDGWR